jgi:hypothetical protein
MHYVSSIYLISQPLCVLGLLLPIISTYHCKHIQGVIQNILDWCCHLYSSYGSVRHRSQQGQTVNSGFCCEILW